MNIRTPKVREKVESRKQANESEDTSAQSDPQDHVYMIYFTPILGVTLSVGDSVHVFSPKHVFNYNGFFEEASVSKDVLNCLLLLMGRGRDAIESASVGSVVGIRGIDDVVLITAALSCKRPRH